MTKPPEFQPPPRPATSGLPDGLKKDVFSRRSFLAGSAATAAALALPANRLLQPLAAPKGTADDVLSIALYAPPSLITTLNPFLTAWEKSNGIKLNFIALPASGWVDFFEQVSTRLAGGQTIDSANVATEGMLLFAERGLLDPLDPYIAKDKALLEAFYDDMNPHILSQFRALDNWHGHSYFLPWGYNVMSMWINRPLFKEFNLPEPGPDWTWDDFERAAKAIAAAPNRYGYAIGTPPAPFNDVYPWVLTAGGEIMNAAQSKCVANNAAAIEAATFVRSLVTGNLANQPGGSYNAITEAAGLKLGMMGAGFWPLLELPLTPKQIKEQFSIVRWPQKEQPATPVGLGSFPIFSSSKAKPAMWEFIKWTLSEEFQAVVVPYGLDGTPMRRSVYTPEFLAKYPSGFENFTTELTNCTLIVGVPNAGAVESEISNVWGQILSGAITPAEGMKTMEDTCNHLMTQKV
jgi:multiple sugar transport system substrate-binding protein